MRKIASAHVTFLMAIEICKEKINNLEFLNFARKRPEDFTRKRKMPFDQLIFFMLNMVKCSTQTCLDRFFELIGQEHIHMKQQSFSEARQKIKWEAFRELLETIVETIYTGFYETWHGYRVSAIDGSKTQLPDEQKLRDYFGTVGKGNTAATAQASILYDVYNNVVMDAHMEPIATGERKLALLHIDALRGMPSFGKECIIFDRGYASFEFIETLISHEIHFVMRVKRGFNKSIDQLDQGDHSFTLQKNGHRDISLRVIKFNLPSGEEEILITDISDKRMGVKAFKKLYFRRWPVETKYDEVKNKLAMENFSGRTVTAVKQDFFITMFMSNIISIACWEVQVDVDKEQEGKDNKYTYHVNVSHAIGTLKDRFILAMLEPNRNIRDKKVERILLLLKERVVPKRPDRSLPRNPSPRKAKFRHNRKLNC